MEQKYARLYEEGMNPFKEFQGQQRERQKKALSVADRAMYALMQLVFGTKPARLFVFFYLLAMHLLVFSSVIRMAHHTSGALEQHHEALLGKGRHDVTEMLQG